MTIHRTSGLLLQLFIAFFWASTAHAGEALDSKAPPEQVVVLHGLARGSRSMAPLADTLRKAGYRVTNIAYKSRKKDSSELIAELQRGVAACCEGSPALVHFVTHSLGGILVRAYLAESRPANLGRVVQLAPPNHGSELVDVLGGSLLFAAMLGPIATELGTEESSLPNSLASPDYELGVIAGMRSINPIGSVLLPGPDDGAVTVESTKLEGATDFIAIKATHTFIMRNDLAQRQVLNFLRSGRFDHQAQ